MSLLAPPSTRKKKASARRVFGTSILEGVDESLCYSYSEDEPTGNSIAADKSTNVSKMFLQTDQEPSKENTVNDSGIFSSSLYEVDKSSSLSTSKVSVIGPFDKIIDSKGENSKTPAKLSKDDSRIQEKLRVMRQLNIKSPVRRNRVKATQDAIDQAAISVNKSLNAANVSKFANQRGVAAISIRERQGWKDSKAEAKAISQLSHQTRLQAILLEKQLSSHLSRERAKRKQNDWNNKLQEIEKETEFKSYHFREQQRRLREDKELRHRKSMAARALLRANYRQGKTKLHMQKIDEEKAIFEERHATSIAIRDFKRENDEKRRKSFVFRNGDARRIRKLYAELEAKRLQSEHESFELRRAAEKDADAYKRQMEEIRRESLAGRNALARKQRELSKEIESVSMSKEHESYELKWAGEKDVEAYRAQLQEERRKSLALRGEENLRQRQLLLEVANENARAEHESYELKWAGEKDVELHREKLEKERRESLAFRNNEAKRQRELKDKLRGEALSLEHQSYELKWDAERDAKAYECRLASERRQSFQGRNEAGRKWRVMETEIASVKAQEDHASYELKWAGEKDAEAYEKKLQQERRESFAFRNREGVRHANVMAELRSIAMEKEHESYVLKWAAENDAKAYLAQLEKQRRESLQLRGKEKLHEREVANQKRDEELKQMHKDEELRAIDQNEIEQYRKECAARDRASLEYRRKEARAQRISQQLRLLKEKSVESKNFHLESEARRDVEEYLKECKRRRRLSLAFRAKERRVHAQWQQKRADQLRQDISEEVQGRLLDHHYMELAQQQERARIALKAIRHAGCSRKA